MNYKFAYRGCCFFVLFNLFSGLAYLSYLGLTFIFNIFYSEIELLQNEDLFFVRLIPMSVLMIYGIFIAIKASKEIADNKSLFLKAIKIAIQNTWPFPKKNKTEESTSDITEKDIS